MSERIGPISPNDAWKLRYPPYYDSEGDCGDEEEPEFLDEDSYPEEKDQ